MTNNATPDYEWDALPPLVTLEVFEARLPLLPPLVSLEVIEAWPPDEGSDTGDGSNVGRNIGLNVARAVAPGI